MPITNDPWVIDLRDPETRKKYTTEHSEEIDNSCPCESHSCEPTPFKGTLIICGDEWFDVDSKTILSFK